MRRGFTLVELMTTVGIIGALAGISVYVYKEYNYQTKISNARSFLESLVINNVAYYHTNGSFISNVTNLDLTAGTSSSTTAIPSTTDNYIVPSLARVTLSTGAAGTNACAYGIIKGFISDFRDDQYITGNAVNNYLDLQYISIAVNGKIKTLCYYAADATVDLYTEDTVSGCTSMTFGGTANTQTEAASFISQCP